MHISRYINYADVHVRMQSENTLQWKNIPAKKNHQDNL